jgi:hypothetical protein
MGDGSCTGSGWLAPVTVLGGLAAGMGGLGS